MTVAMVGKYILLNPVVHLKTDESFCYILAFLRKHQKSIRRKGLWKIIGVFIYCTYWSSWSKSCIGQFLITLRFYLRFSLKLFHKYEWLLTVVITITSIWMSTIDLSLLKNSHESKYWKYFLYPEVHLLDRTKVL